MNLNHSESARILERMTPEEKALWRAKLDASRRVDAAEHAFTQARKALSLARRIKRKADNAFEASPTGAAWLANIRQQVDDDIAATMAARRAERAAQPAAA